MNHQTDAQEFFEQVATGACQELFARYGVPVVRVADRDEPLSPDFLLCAVIGFSGKNVRGTLVLALTEELPMLSSPIGPMPANPATRAITQRDWVGELANQLLGRVKIELLRCGVEIYLNLPAVLRGKHLAPLPRVELKPLKFTLGESVVALWVETEALPGFKIDGQHLDDQQGPAAGDALLFE